ncbi:b(0,+)-type amino acid transporter 1-like isoform X3 [Montipora capricornis]|uniref:b(0,+)-type amino acid transporter 1-like isoform X3 n=1 Tax=Montipora capricornis TaxID=246305 RepID=UPI0035F152FA
MERSSSNILHVDLNNKWHSTPVSLKRSVGVPSAVALLVGTIIGSGIFATPKWVLLYAGSVGMSLVIWTLCGFIALSCALCYCELGTLIPKSGGEYPYIMEAYGNMPAFLFSYVFVLFAKPSTVMILLVFGAYVIEPFFPGCGGRADLVPLVKILAVAALGYTSSLKSGFQGTNWNIGKLSFAFYSGLFPYGGWNLLNYFTEEIKNPNKNLPFSIWLGIPVVTVCYLLVNIGYVTVLTTQEILNTDAVAVISSREPIFQKSRR